MTLITPFNALILAGAVVVSYRFWKLVYSALIVPLTSSLRYLPGPPSRSFFLGHLKEIFEVESAVLHERWTDTYGSTFKSKGFMKVRFKALSYTARI